MQGQEKENKIMEFEKFLESLKNKIAEFSPETEIVERVVTKTNGLTYRGLSLREPKVDAYFTISIDNLYKSFTNKNMDMDAFTLELLEFYRNNQPNEAVLNLSKLVYNFDNIKDKIFLRIVNKEMNEKLLTEVPHREMYDLAIIYGIKVSENEDEFQTTNVINEFIKEWGITEEELFQIALKHVNEEEFEMLKMSSIIKLPPHVKDAFDEVMFVLTNKQRNLGSNVILNQKFMDEVYDKIGKFIILPSSIHEVIAVKIQGNSMVPNNDTLRGMIHEVNNECVAPQEILSFNAYVYEKGKGIKILN